MKGFIKVLSAHSARFFNTRGRLGRGAEGVSRSPTANNANHAAIRTVLTLSASSTG
jgi:hypothetical protein